MRLLAREYVRWFRSLPSPARRAAAASWVCFALAAVGPCLGDALWVHLTRGVVLMGVMVFVLVDLRREFRREVS